MDKDSRTADGMKYLRLVQFNGRSVSTPIDCCHPYRDPVEAATTPAPVDVIEELSRALASGKITGDEAVRRLMDGECPPPPCGLWRMIALVKAAPESFQAEIREVLTAMVETEPHLVSLARSLHQSAPPGRV